MYCIISESDNPFFNLAIEELLLKNSDKEYLILGINSPSVIVGKHQATNKEVNTKFVIQNNIPVIRRISGGGTVFHDKGNLNFTFIRQTEYGKQVDFRKYTQPVINFLSAFGVEALFEGKNDLKVNGLKISGNAEHVHHNRVLHHGTILFNSSLEMLRNSIRKDTSHYSTRGVQSNPSSVMNISDIQDRFRDIYEFRSEMMKYFLKTFPGAENYRLSSEEIKKAEYLAESKYKSWEWNWAYGPDYSFSNRFQFNNKACECCLDVKNGLIVNCSIRGSDELLAVAERFIGKRHMFDDISDIFNEENFVVSREEINNFF